MSQAWPRNSGLSSIGSRGNDNWLPPTTSILPKIAICIPYNSNWEPEWVETTYGPLRYNVLDWCEKISIMSKAPSLPVARDMLVKKSLEFGCDYIFWLDSDVLFESPTDPNLALRNLYQVINKDPSAKDCKIVSGLYRARKKDGFTNCMWEKVPCGVQGYIAIGKWTGNWIQADVTGLGCCLTDINVFKDMPEPYFQWSTKEAISEDFYFMEKAKEYGYNTKVFTDVKMSHIIKMKLKSDGTMSMIEM